MKDTLVDDQIEMTSEIISIRPKRKPQRADSIEELVNHWKFYGRIEFSEDVGSYRNYSANQEKIDLFEPIEIYRRSRKEKFTVVRFANGCGVGVDNGCCWNGVRR